MGTLMSSSTTYITPEEIRHHPENWEPVANSHDPRIHSTHYKSVVIFTRQGQSEQAEIVDPGWFSSHLNEHFTSEQFYVESNPGFPVVLPNGSTISDRYSTTGKLMSPVPDLSPVAAAGTETLREYRRLMEAAKIGYELAKYDPPEALAAGTLEAAAKAYLAERLGTNVGTGGTFDYQRSGNMLSYLQLVGLKRFFSFKQLPQFRDVSNFNVGLFCQKAGLSLNQTLSIAGDFAKLFSSNSNSAQSFGLAPRTAEFIRYGYSKASLYR
jgi:hypothetical protein